MEPEPKVRRLAEADLPAAVRLSTQAGWNQTAADWRRLLMGWPDGCLAAFDPALLATGTLATFAATAAPPTGWIGMILVEERHRGRGHGGAMMRRLLEMALAMRLAGVGLDATDMGRPVYEKLGFRPHSTLCRWLGSPPLAAAIGGADTRLRPLLPADWPAVATLDRQATGVERLPLLRGLAAEPAAAAVVSVEGDHVTGFGLSRAGRTARAIGPVVARTAAIADSVATALLAATDDEPMIIDVPEGSPLETVVEAAGFSVMRRVTRMLLPIAGTPASLVSPLVHAVVSFELG